MILASWFILRWTVNYINNWWFMLTRNSFLHSLVLHFSWWTLVSWPKLNQLLPIIFFHHFREPSLLWHYWLGIRKSIQCVKVCVMRCWCDYVSGVGQIVSIWSSWCRCYPKTPLSLASFKSRLVFTARCYASAVLAMALCPSVCLSVTRQCCTKTAKRRITQTTPLDSPGTLVSWRQRSPRNSTGVAPYEGTECRWGGSKSATFDK